MVTERLPLIIPPDPYNRFYLETKGGKSGHLLEQIDHPVVEGMTGEQVVSIQE